MVREGTVTKPEYIIREDKLFYKGRLVVPRNSKYITLILQEFHDGLQGGHSGVLKTLKRVQSQF